MFFNLGIIKSDGKKERVLNWSKGKGKGIRIRVKEIRVMELFAGVGGFRLGLEAADKDLFKTVWANQWEPSRKRQDAYDVYIRRFGEEGVSNEDISLVDESQFSGVDMIVGGFPCQEYSVARSTKGEKGIQGKKGVLFWDIVRFTESIKPKYLLLENVDRLLKSPSKQRGRDFGVMLATLNELGYEVEWRVIDASKYGNVQRRKRVFIFAIRNDLDFARELREGNVGEILMGKGFFAKEFSVYKEDVELEGIEIGEDILEVSDSFKGEFKNTGMMVGGKVYTLNTTPIEEDGPVLGDILEEDVGEEYYLTEEQIERFTYLKGSKRIERTSASGHSYTYSEGVMSFPDSKANKGRTMLTSEAGVNRSTHVVKDAQTGKLRYLTPTECERMNGFKDGWTEGISKRMRYFTMGNALVVPLIERMGKRLREIKYGGNK